MKITKINIFEWLGVVTAIVYSLLVAANIGAEFIGFSLLLTSSAFIGIWAFVSPQLQPQRLIVTLLNLKLYLIVKLHHLQPLLVLYQQLQLQHQPQQIQRVMG